MDLSASLENRVAELEKIVGKLNEMDLRGSGSVSVSVSDSKDKKDKKKGVKKRSGYLIYSNEKRNEVKEMLEKNVDGKVKPQEVVSKLGELWKNLTDDEREKYNNKAKEEREEQEEE